jgi:hypothetical protein
MDIGHAMLLGADVVCTALGIYCCGVATPCLRFGRDIRSKLMLMSLTLGPLLVLLRIRANPLNQRVP